MTGTPDFIPSLEVRYLDALPLGGSEPEYSMSATGSHSVSSDARVMLTVPHFRPMAHAQRRLANWPWTRIH